MDLGLLSFEGFLRDWEVMEVEEGKWEIGRCLGGGKLKKQQHNCVVITSIIMSPKLLEFETNNYGSSLLIAQRNIIIEKKSTN